jgi:ribonuclease HI/exonuclease III
MTKATANNDHNRIETNRTIHTGTGLSLSESRRAIDSAASQSSNDRPREIRGRPQTTTIPTLIRTTNRPHQGKKTKATLKIASLNLRGRGLEKWNHVNQLLRDNKIGILAVQESHLDDDKIIRLETLFPKRIKILHTADPNTINAKGVAIVMNKELTNTSNVTTYEIIPGRALLLKTNWHANQTLTILAIYAPNNPVENKEFWLQLLTKWQTRNLPRPDIMLGDFNIVEDSIDRLPCHPDNTEATEALQDLKSELLLQDSWRRTFPTTKTYSYLQKSTGSQSRIDRIYTTEEIYKFSLEWNIHTTGIQTDHKLISVLISSPTLPYVGKGRWMMPVNLLKNKTLLNEIQKLTQEVQKTLEETTLRTPEINPQTIYKRLKEDILKIARQISKTQTPKLTKTIQKKQKQLASILENPNLNLEYKQITSMELEEEIAKLEKITYTTKRMHIAAKNRLEGETISKYWTQLNKSKTPRDTILMLKYPNSTPPIFEKNSQKMAELAKDYHNNLQTKDQCIDLSLEAARARAYETITTTTTPEDNIELAHPLSELEIALALKCLPNYKAAGMDGIPCELWKILEKQYSQSKNTETPQANIVKILTLVFNDIETYGIAPNTDFSLGWLCPIYKKGDVKEIANYRPITILNADYKILTKTLNNRLTKVIHKLLHPDQVGFIPGRSIFNSIKQSELLINYAETKEENGLIVELDQEKAYDKINHNYLWEILKRFGIPEHFINIVKTLYNNANTRVIINGVISTPYQVNRGVRQGDPLSCLLFDLAIEPLASTLRNSNLEGYRIPNLPNKLITNLFADDTSVYLRENDNFSELQEILTDWCKASGAKFNIAKTEIIPIGQQEFRNNVIQTRKLNPDQLPIPNEIHIAQDGEPVRILGAWMGNKLNNISIWTPTLEKIDKSLAQWAKSHPTLRGKRLIIQMIIGGMTQFLTKAQGEMPPEIESRLIKKIRNFIWGEENTPIISMPTLSLPIAKGGLKLLDLKSRNKAIQATWLKTFLQLNESRPSWTYIADELINSQLSHKYTDRKARINMFLQSWKVNPNATSKLPRELTAMLRIGHELNTKFEVLNPTSNIKNKLPVWHHIGGNNALIELTNKPQAKCLRHLHQISTVSEMNELANQTNENHQPRRNCNCNNCTTIRNTAKCKNPHKCQEMAQIIMQTLQPKWNPNNNTPPNHLNLTPRRKARNKQAETTGEPILFDPNNSVDQIEEGFRIFTKNEDENQDQENRANNRPEGNQSITIYTDGSCTNTGQNNAQAGSGNWYGVNDPRNKAYRVPGLQQTNQTAELYAILQAIKNTPPETELIIRTDSQYAIKALTRYLHKWEDKGWTPTNGYLVKTIAAWLRHRTNTTYFHWIKGHSGELGNEGADKLAAEGTLQPQTIEMNLTSPPSYTHNGAKLSTITQSELYKGFLRQTAPINRQSTEATLEMVREAVKDLSNELPTDKTIWHSLQNQDLTRTIKTFLWKCLHNAYRVGKFWERIPNNEHRATCPTCRVEESMEHILLECNAPGQREAWNTARLVWQKKQEPWPRLTYGTILGASLAKFPDSSNNQGTSRLFKIVVTETAFLIWKLRCERRIGNNDNPTHSNAEVRNRWLATINQRLTLDRLTTDCNKYGKKALKQRTVLKTWDDILLDKENLPMNWIQQSGVLVGMRPQRPPGRNR